MLTNQREVADSVLEARLWIADAKDKLYRGDAAAYQTAVLEQYKCYVERSLTSPAERIGAP